MRSYACGHSVAARWPGHRRWEGSLADTGLHIGGIEAVCVGAGGVDWPAQRARRQSGKDGRQRRAARAGQRC